MQNAEWRAKPNDGHWDVTIKPSASQGINICPLVVLSWSYRGPVVVLLCCACSPLVQRWYASSYNSDATEPTGISDSAGLSVIRKKLDYYADSFLGLEFGALASVF